MARDAHGRASGCPATAPGVPAAAFTASLQALPRSVRGHRRFPGQAGLRAVAEEPAAVQELHRQHGDDGRGRRGSPGFAAVRRHPRVDGPRGAAAAPAFSALLHEFYAIAAAAISEDDGVVDKFVGDEAIGLFIPGYAGLDHASKAIAAGRRLLADVGTAGASTEGPIPVGAGVHTGIAFVGTVGSSTEISDFTALGDPVNTTARIAQLAVPASCWSRAKRRRKAGSMRRASTAARSRCAVAERRWRSSW